MNFIQVELPGVWVIEPDVIGDERGYFLESYNQEKYSSHIDHVFVQDNHSRSRKNILRGLHAQNPHQQGKLVRVTRGEVFDVAVDIRVGSPVFGKWYGRVLAEDNFLQMFIPPGFAHGFCVLSDVAELQYKCTDLYHPESEIIIAWDDPDIGIRWPVVPMLSRRDQQGLRLARLESEGQLPEYL